MEKLDKQKDRQIVIDILIDRQIGGNPKILFFSQGARLTLTMEKKVC